MTSGHTQADGPMVVELQWVTSISHATICPIKGPLPATTSMSRLGRGSLHCRSHVSIRAQRLFACKPPGNGRGLTVQSAEELT